MNSTMGVLPLPPHVKFPTLITGTGKRWINGRSCCVCKESDEVRERVCRKMRRLKEKGEERCEVVRV